MDKRIIRYCTGCGLCVSEKKATLVNNADGFAIPQSGDEEWLKQICPTMARQEAYMDKNKIWGKATEVYTGWSNDLQLRNKASSGGILTELASYLLDTKEVDCVIHTSASKDNPLQTEVCYSYTREDLIARCGSRYTISHPLIELSNIKAGMRYVFIGKPCDVAALRNYIRIRPELNNSIIYLLSFFCMGEPSATAQKNLLSALGCEKSKCKKITYRGNGWPGYTTAVDADGNEYKLDYATAWGRILGRDVMPSCKFCLDGIGELADISCADGWYLNKDGKPDFEERDGRNVIFARTEKGASLLERAKNDKRITLTEYQDYEDELKKIQRSQYERRISMKTRIAALKFTRNTYPAYSKEILSSFSSHCPFKKKLKAFLGTCKRIFKGEI
jgi:coenzyme F420 hydrogenase subunit beta